MYFPSKKDLWLGVLLWVTSILPFVIFIWRPIKTGLFISSLLLLFIGWIWFKTGYTINDEELIAQSGPFRWKISLDQIKEVHYSHSIFSSPALSLDRLEIKFSNGNFILISPKDTNTFLDMLKERCPNLKIE